MTSAGLQLETKISATPSGQHMHQTKLLFLLSKADDWELLEYPKFLSPMDLLSLKIKIKPDKPLPTMPELKIRKLDGLPNAENLTEPTQLTEELIPFYLTKNEDEKSINCLEKPENCTTSFIFEKMGMAQQLNDEGERKKRESAQGTKMDVNKNLSDRGYVGTRLRGSTEPFNF